MNGILLIQGNALLRSIDVNSPLTAPLPLSLFFLLFPFLFIFFIFGLPPLSL